MKHIKHHMIDETPKTSHDPNVLYTKAFHIIMDASSNMGPSPTITKYRHREKGAKQTSINTHDTTLLLATLGPFLLYH